MSYLTGQATELIYASTATGTAQATFTAERALNDVAGMGPRPKLPADFWLPGSAVAKTLLIQARGILSSTATPTYTFSFRLGANGSTTAAIILGTAALTTISGAANAYWEIEGVVTLRAIGDAGANSTVQGIGRILCGGLASPFIYPVFGAAASPGTVATVDTSIVNYLNVNIACSASSASNTITLQHLAVFGVN